MATFVLICIDRPDALELRLATRQAHFDYLAANPGVVRLGGPFLNAAGEMAGSLLLIEADDLAAAEAFGAADPYRLAGLFERVEIRPWRATVGQLP
ncbi:MAG TPA: YciI family protein [Caulobacteraceae bacterium]|nr:YciI family protein [Caulobacteraceae bacterium]